MQRGLLSCVLVSGCLILGLTGIAGCGGSGSPPPVVVGPEVPQPSWNVHKTTRVLPAKKWTFLVYMNAANDLEEYGSLNMNQMETVGSSSDINIVVQFKRIANRYDSSNGDWSDTRRYVVTKDNDPQIIHSDLTAQKDSVDMGDWHTLQEFVQWGTKAFPAEHYALVLWNHGAGWRSRAAVTRRATRGFSYDDVTNNHIDTVQLPQAVNFGRKWDIIAFDSSLMQMLEVAYEIRDQAQYIVGSEESPPGEGYPYDRFLKKLAQSPGKSGRDFAGDIAQETIAGYGPSSDITQSVLDASRVAAIVPAANQLGAALLGAQNQWGAQIAQARDLSEEYAYSYYHDLIDFTQLLREPPSGASQPRVNQAAVVQAAAQVESLTRAALVVSVSGSQHPHSNGLSIFLPTPSQYSAVDRDQASGFGQRYYELAFTKAAPNWQSFVAQGPP